MPKKRKKKTSSKDEKSSNKIELVVSTKDEKKKKKTRKRKSSSKSKSSTKKVDREIEHAILQNLVELQKVQTGMSEKFSHLAKEISSLLALFEVTARNFAKNIPENDQFTKDKEFLDKIDKLLDQNKTLAKGLTIMEERLRERLYSAPGKMAPGQKKEEKKEEEFKPSMRTLNRPLPRF